AFLFGWTLLLVIQTGTIAAVAVAFARFLGVIWPVLGSRIWFGWGSAGISGERAGAILVIALLTFANLRGLNMGRLVQNSFTTAKIAALIVIVVAGCVLLPNPDAIRANFASHAAFFGTGRWSLAYGGAFGAAMVGAIFSADAWATVTFTASEVRNPKRDLPLALALGSGGVILLYLLTNVAYLCALPAVGDPAGMTVFARGIAHATSDRVATAAMQVLWGGRGATFTAFAVMISTFGCANGLILTGARVIYAMAHDRVFLQAGARLNTANVPALALVIQAVWAALLAISGSYSELLDYVVFAQLIFYVLTVSAVFVLRRRFPSANRPYRAWGYPIVPAIYIIAALLLMGDLLIERPHSTWPGLLIVLSGVPVYAIFLRNKRSRVIE
ncbi:MAG TPA: amino acid permease, partial [Candidatus Binataceae bacterium]